MKVLWLCNIMLPAVAEHFHRESSNKEGWLSGLLTAVLSHGDSNGIELAVAFPVAERLSYSAEAAGSDTVDAADRKNVREHHDGTEACGHRSRLRGICIPCGETYFTAYDFVEDTTRPDLYDPALEQMEEQLAEVESLLADYNHDVSEYMSDLEFDEADFGSTEERLNTINHLKGKYGNSIEEILKYKEEKETYLEKLADYDAYMQKLHTEWEEKQTLLTKACEKLSKIRQENAAALTQKLKAALINLNFLTVEFDIAVRPGQTITAKGYDDVEFLISTNPGESLKPLSQVASGGELSRIMLAIKTVLAGRDEIDTLIFDEIDTGISGRTAWKVAEQLSVLSGAHQVSCITHLPQIAAMADVHFVIEKSSTDDMTITDIQKVADEESLAELARLLGSDALTEAALSNAKEMKEQANAFKEVR